MKTIRVKREIRSRRRMYLLGRETGGRGREAKGVGEADRGRGSFYRSHRKNSVRCKARSASDISLSDCLLAVFLCVRTSACSSIGLRHSRDLRRSVFFRFSGPLAASLCISSLFHEPLGSLSVSQVKKWPAGANAGAAGE